MDNGFTVDAVNKIESLVKAANEKENAVLQINDERYWVGSKERIVVDPRPETIMVSSLSAIVAYITDNRESLEKEKIFIHVVDHSCVKVRGIFEGPNKKRTLYMEAGLEKDFQVFPFGQFMSSEQFNIGLLSLFENTEDGVTLCEIVATLKSEESAENEDDRATTKRKTYKGVYTTSQKEIPQVISLKPYRTFLQVDQPESPFILRIRTDADHRITCALMEADGGAWRHTAMANICEYLRNALPGVQIIY